MFKPQTLGRAIFGAGQSESGSEMCLKITQNGHQEKVKCTDSKLDILCQVRAIKGNPIFLDEVESIYQENLHA